MPSELVFFTGGIRSGKSRLALSEAAALAGERGRVTFIATASAGDADPGMAARIAAHRAARPARWTTIESSVALDEALRNAAADSDVLLVDCLTLWVSRILAGAGNAEASEARARASAAVRSRLGDMLRAAGDIDAALVVVSNEVGSGIAPPTNLGNLFADLLGEVNAAVAAASDRAYLVAAGLPLRLK